MIQFRDRDLLTLLAGVREIHEARDLDALADTAISLVCRLVPADHTAYTELNPAQGRVAARFDSPDGERASQAVLPAFQRLMPQHPLLNLFLRRPHSGTQRMSDVMTPHEYRRTPLYQEVYRHLDGQHHMVVPISAADGEGKIGVAMNRRLSDFTDGERAMLNLLRPHLAQAYRALVARLRARALIEGRDPGQSCEDLQQLGLTRREAEVLVWVLQGKTNPEAATILGVSPRTVDKHLENTFRKLGVSTRMGAIVAVLERLRR